MSRHYIARVRDKQQLQLSEIDELISVGTFHKKARTTPQYLRQIQLTRVQCYVACVFSCSAGTGWKLSKWDRHKAYKEPWLQVISLPQVHDHATKIANATQLECKYQEQKSHTYGLGSEDHKTYRIDRLKALILLATLAIGLHYMLCLAIEINGQHRTLQANSNTHRRVLSFNYLGKRLCRFARAAITNE